MRCVVAHLLQPVPASFVQVLQPLLELLELVPEFCSSSLVVVCSGPNPVQLFLHVCQLLVHPVSSLLCHFDAVSALLQLLLLLRSELLLSSLKLLLHCCHLLLVEQGILLAHSQLCMMLLLCLL
jgi:hypothetical protein